jgi:hypothetical protein
MAESHDGRHSRADDRLEIDRVVMLSVVHIVAKEPFVLDSFIVIRMILTLFVRIRLEIVIIVVLTFLCEFKTDTKVLRV